MRHLISIYLLNHQMMNLIRIIILQNQKGFVINLNTLMKLSINLSKDQIRFEPQKNYQWRRISKLNTNRNLCQDFKYAQIKKGDLKMIIFQMPQESCRFMVDQNCLQRLLQNDEKVKFQKRIYVQLQDVNLKKVFLTKQFQSNCQYRLVLNQQGLWREIVIDDYLPLNMCGKPLFYYYDGEDYWVQLIEKAFSKIYGCSEKLEQIEMINELLRVITGAPYLVLDEQEFNYKQQKAVNLQNIFYLTYENKENIFDAK